MSLSSSPISLLLHIFQADPICYCSVGKPSTANLFILHNLHHQQPNLTDSRDIFLQCILTLKQKITSNFHFLNYYNLCRDTKIVSFTSICKVRDRKIFKVLVF